MSAHRSEVAAMAHALEVVLARVRCRIVHEQVNGGRCVSCISWAKNVGVPAHLPRMITALDEAKDATP